MTFSNILRPFALVITGCVLGWWAHKLPFFDKRAVMSFHPSARMLKVKDKEYSFKQLPLDFQLKIHAAFMQAQMSANAIAGQVAAQIAVNDGQLSNEFDWDKFLEPTITDGDIQKTHQHALGFKGKGPLTDPKVRAEVLKDLVQREKVVRIGDEVARLERNNELKVYLDYPPAPQLQEDVSAYPVVEAGSEGVPIEQEIQVLFSYAQRDADVSFFSIASHAEHLKRRLKVRLLFESRGTPKELAAIGLIHCLSSQSDSKRDAWVTHLRLTQEVFQLADSTTELPFEKFFPGDPDLVKRIKACAPKKMDEKMLADNSKNWKKIRVNNFPVLFLQGRKISEFDPRGVRGVLAELAAKP